VKPVIEIVFEGVSEWPLLVLVDGTGEYMKYPICFANVCPANYPSVDMQAINELKELKKPYMKLTSDWVEPLFGMSLEDLATLTEYYFKR
jgi:hypothetical protein